MCGRYAVGDGPGHVRIELERNRLPVRQAPPEEANGDIRRHFNVAPGNYQLVYRAFPGDPGNTPGEAPGDTMSGEPGVVYALEYMKWGLIPSWSTSPPNYPGLLKTINCRSDSLAENKPLWSMKNNKRCIVVALGFYEWLHKGKEKVPHFIKRKDGEMMLFAGLWDCVQYEGSQEKLYTYTIITTEANEQLSFLHERMPAILEPSTTAEVIPWLSPKIKSWNSTLQSLLKPYQGALEVYPVSKDVGKVALDSPSFIIPVDSAENKSNIKNFFVTPKKGIKSEATPKEEEPKGGDDNVEITGSSVKQETSEASHSENSSQKPGASKKPMKSFFVTPNKTLPSSSQKFKKEEKDAPGASLPPHIPFRTETPSSSRSPLPSPSAASASRKRERLEGGDEELARKLARLDRPEEEGDEELARKLEMEERLLSSPLGPRTRSSITNTPASVKAGAKKKATPAKGKGKDKGSQKITSFFGK
ncbi:DUF159-domain-containing protein [Tuber magnatum]|uniref:DUF159-domain-containing protein n=1 Tax=Tuber magnatum TaxID=42249 RepID=A0A317SHX4_9PEZI|nr:DUF159-domain-containing protein [Tuber magnatum]